MKSNLAAKILTKPQPYLPIWQAMKNRTDARIANPSTFQDEIWLLEHQPVFTQGQAGKDEHILNPHDIPVVRTDRGGQVTYHGPGQLMIYFLINIQSQGMNTRDYVHALEQIIINYLATKKITANNKTDAPGVYVNNDKICSIGLRVRKGLSYHGLAFNLDMDLTPFEYINPCGFTTLRMTQLKAFQPTTIATTITELLPAIAQKFGYNQCEVEYSTLTELSTHG